MDGMNHGVCASWVHFPFGERTRRRGRGLVVSETLARHQRRAFPLGIFISITLSSTCHINIMSLLREVPSLLTRAPVTKRTQPNRNTRSVPSQPCPRTGRVLHCHAQMRQIGDNARGAPGNNAEYFGRRDRTKSALRTSSWASTTRNVVALASLEGSGHRPRPSEIVKFHLGLVRRSSSLMKSCTIRRLLRLLQSYLDAHSAFDARRVISRVVYDADVAFLSAREAAEKLVEGERRGGADANSMAYPPSAVIRRYTVTHSDETGVLTTSVGSEYDQTQLRSLKQRLFRDRVLGELVVEDSARYMLHLYAYVAGKYLVWPCPAAVRSYIFQRDINLVVESIVFADKDHLEAVQADTKVLLHLESDSQDFANETMVFAKVLGDRSTWALGASDSSKLRLTHLWERIAAAAYSFLVLQKDRKNDACGEACNVSCILDSKGASFDSVHGD